MTILPHVEGPVTVINVITVTPEEQQTRIDMMLHTARETMSRQPGFLSAEVLKSVDGRRVAVCARWESVEAFRAVFGQPEVLAFMQQAVTQVPMEWHAYQAVETVKSPAFESGY